MKKKKAKAIRNRCNIIDHQIMPVIQHEHSLYQRLYRMTIEERLIAGIRLRNQTGTSTGALLDFSQLLFDEVKNIENFIQKYDSR